MRILLISLCLTFTVSCSQVLAKNPYTPGFPECVAQVAGYWQPYLERDQETNTALVWIAITSQNVLDPSTIICWIPAQGFIQVVNEEFMKEHKNPAQPAYHHPKEQASLSPTNRYSVYPWTLR